MSSISGRRRADGQRVSPSLAALCAPSTLTLNFAAKYPKPAVRSILDAVFGLVSAPYAKDASSRDLVLDVPGGPPIPARLHEPEGLGPDAPLLVFFHGGGFILGSLTSHQNTCRFTAKRARCKVLAVGYRKAPEHRFPAAYEDCRAALRWAIAHAQELGVDPSRIAVGGDSAGGNLAVAATLGLGADEPGPVGVWLIYPLVDSDIAAYESAQLFAAGPLLTRQNSLDMVHHYAPRGADLLDPRLSVVHADNLDQLPQTYIATAGMDPIRDQAERFAEQLTQAGVDVEHERLRDMPHGFDLLLIDAGARQATEQTVAALARMLGTA
jgi:acetyl esterase